MSDSRHSPIRVLVVEDREDDFIFLSHVFAVTRNPVYRLDWRGSYEAGLAALREGGHDIALFDYNLGGATGIDLLREAQAMECEMPILLLTGHDSREIDEEALRAGAVDFIDKAGLDPVQLERAIRYALRQAETRAQLRQSRRQLDLFMQSVPCAVAIRDEDGALLFQNGIFARNFPADDGAWPAGADHDPAAGPAPRPAVSNGRQWLVNSFAMVGPDRRRLRGFAALDVTERVRAEEERRKAAHLLDSIMQSLPVVAGRVDAAGRVIEASGHGLEPAGIRPEELVGRVFQELYPAAAGALQEALAGEDATFALSGQHEGKPWHAEFFMTFDAAQGAGATFFGRDVTARRWLERRLLTLTDDEQQRIGADLHDGLGQQLTGLSCLAAALRDRLKAALPAEARQAGQIAELANEAVAQSRALAHGLCPVQLENEGLLLALEEMAVQTRTIHGVECHFTLKGPPPQYDHLTALHLYRITQEAVHNAVRHGKARQIRISLISRAQRHQLSIADNGRGFEPAAHRRAPGGGLRLMAYRAAAFGGEISVDSHPGGGTRITCRFSTFNNNETNHHGQRSDPKSFEVAR
jgi:signal transduction histidine kinase